MPEESTRGRRHLPLELAAGEDGFLVDTCRSARDPEYAGFYLVERGRSNDTSNT